MLSSVEMTRKSILCLFSLAVAHCLMLELSSYLLLFSIFIAHSNLDFYVCNY